MSLIVATCQYPIDGDIARNCRYVLKQMTAAKRRGAAVAHFPESALSGYAGIELKSHDQCNWKLLEESARRIIEAAGEIGIWVVLGSSHRLTGKHKPHNSVYVINDQGRLVDRYDKRFCAGRADDPKSELAHYSPGDHPCVFDIGSVRCATLICHEYRYPELYREYKRLGAQLVFHFFHAGNVPPKRLKSMRRQAGANARKLNRGDTLPEITMPAGMQSAAADNYLWISCSNTSAAQCCWGSFAVRPDGVVVGRLRKNTAGVLCTKVDPEQSFYDSTAPWRDRAMRGVLHSGKLVRDKRSTDRTSL